MTLSKHLSNFEMYLKSNKKKNRTDDTVASYVQKVRKMIQENRNLFVADHPQLKDAVNNTKDKHMIPMRHFWAYLRSRRS